jgi:hypothetical protein
MTAFDPGDGEALGGLEREVVDELRLAEGSEPRMAMAMPVAEWSFDPSETERYVGELHSLLDAVRAIGPAGAKAMPPPPDIA